MRKILFAMAITTLSLGIASRAAAQMGSMGANLFQKPAIAKFVNPVVGKGAEYESTNSNSKTPHTMDLGVVGKESVDGKDGFWMQIITTDNKNQGIVAKGLITKDDFQFHKMVMQVQGQPAMELPYNPNSGHGQQLHDAMTEWHSVGTETITVPAGSFSCEHYKNEKDGSDLWVSDKVTPFGLVKQTGKDSSMVLVKVLDNYQDKISGPVTKFDLQQMLQRSQQGQQKQ
jgi:hypothetical protein